MDKLQHFRKRGQEHPKNYPDQKWVQRYHLCFHVHWNDYQGKVVLKTCSEINDDEIYNST